MKVAILDWSDGVVEGDDCLTQNQWFPKLFYIDKIKFDRREIDWTLLLKDELSITEVTVSANDQKPRNVHCAYVFENHLKQ